MKFKTGLILAVLLSGCSTQAAFVPLNPRATNIAVSETPPGDRRLFAFTSIIVSHGNGCGGLGSKGTYIGAVNMLRNRAAEIGATYLHITSSSEPHQIYGCFVNSYEMRADAYK